MRSNASGAAKPKAKSTVRTAGSRPASATAAGLRPGASAVSSAGSRKSNAPSTTANAGSRSSAVPKSSSRGGSKDGGTTRASVHSNASSRSSLQPPVQKDSRPRRDDEGSFSEADNSAASSPSVHAGRANLDDALAANDGGARPGQHRAAARRPSFFEPDSDGESNSAASPSVPSLASPPPNSSPRRDASVESNSSNSDSEGEAVQSSGRAVAKDKDEGDPGEATFGSVPGKRGSSSFAQGWPTNSSSLAAALSLKVPGPLLDASLGIRDELQDAFSGPTASPGQASAPSLSSPSYSIGVTQPDGKTSTDSSRGDEQVSSPQPPPTQSHKNADVVDTANICVGCGASIRVGHSFCSKCGRQTASVPEDHDEGDRQHEAELRVGFSIENLAFDRLTPGHKAEITHTAKASIAKSAKVSIDGVRVSLSGGSVKVNASLVLPSACIAPAAREPSLQDLHTAAQEVMDKVNRIPDIQAAKEDSKRELNVTWPTKQLSRMQAPNGAQEADERESQKEAEEKKKQEKAQLEMQNLIAQLEEQQMRVQKGLLEAIRREEAARLQEKILCESLSAQLAEAQRELQEERRRRSAEVAGWEEKHAGALSANRAEVEALQIEIGRLRKERDDQASCLQGELQKLSQSHEAASARADKAERELEAARKREERAVNDLKSGPALKVLDMNTMDLGLKSPTSAGGAAGQIDECLSAQSELWDGRGSADLKESAAVKIQAALRGFVVRKAQFDLRKKARKGSNAQEEGKKENGVSKANGVYQHEEIASCLKNMVAQAELEAARRISLEEPPAAPHEVRPLEAPPTAPPERLSLEAPPAAPLEDMSAATESSLQQLVRQMESCGFESPAALSDISRCASPATTVSMRQLPVREALSNVVFDVIDRNHDGVIDRSEWDRAVSSTARPAPSTAVRPEPSAVTDVPVKLSPRAGEGTADAGFRLPPPSLSRPGPNVVLPRPASPQAKVEAGPVPSVRLVSPQSSDAVRRVLSPVRPEGNALPSALPLPRSDSPAQPSRIATPVRGRSTGQNSPYRPEGPVVMPAPAGEPTVVLQDGSFRAPAAAPRSRVLSPRHSPRLQAFADGIPAPADRVHNGVVDRSDRHAAVSSTAPPACSSTTPATGDARFPAPTVVPNSMPSMPGCGAPSVNGAHKEDLCVCGKTFAPTNKFCRFCGRPRAEVAVNATSSGLSVDASMSAKPAPEMFHAPVPFDRVRDNAKLSEGGGTATSSPQVVADTPMASTLPAAGRIPRPLGEVLAELQSSTSTEAPWKDYGKNAPHLSPAATDGGASASSAAPSDRGMSASIGALPNGVRTPAPSRKTAAWTPVPVEVLPPSSAVTPSSAVIRPATSPAVAAAPRLTPPEPQQCVASSHATNAQAPSVAQPQLSARSRASSTSALLRCSSASCARAAPIGAATPPAPNWQGPAPGQSWNLSGSTLCQSAEPLLRRYLQQGPPAFAGSLGSSMVRAPTAPLGGTPKGAFPFGTPPQPPPTRGLTPPRGLL